MRNLTLYTEETILDFGKYKGFTLDLIISTDPNYIIWCVENVEWFNFDSEKYEQLCKSQVNLQEIYNILLKND